MITTQSAIESISTKKAVLLQSGGLDSCYMASLLHYYGFTFESVFVDYGQNSLDKELESAKAISDKYDSPLHIVKIELPWLQDPKVSLLTSNSLVESYDVPKQFGAVNTGIYVPTRNVIFLTIAMSLCESLGINYIAAGLDGKEDVFGTPLSGTPDKHPTFITKMEDVLTESHAKYHTNGSKIRIISPLVDATKEDVIVSGVEVTQAPFELSWTCYNKSDLACGECAACVRRQISFNNVNKKDFIKYINPIAF